LSEEITMHDLEAENAIREAIEHLAALSQPLNCNTVPEAAIHRLDTAGFSDRIYRAIEAMVKRGVLVAPQEPWGRWYLQ
jgi:hypothetical protein